jgi:phosphoglycerol transferase MdoB-like AlkP superfamily enzyme
VPFAFGILADILVLFFGFTAETKWLLLWLYAIIFLLLALIAVFFVRRGEAGEEGKLAETAFN